VVWQAYLPAEWRLVEDTKAWEVSYRVRHIMAIASANQKLQQMNKERKLTEEQFSLALET
jgi:hypothetical protein